MSKIITIDCDGVLSATAESILACNAHTINGISAHIDDITNHWFHHIPKFGLTMDEAKHLRYTFYEQSTPQNLLPEPDAVEVVAALKQQGYRLVVVTARIDAWKPQTIERLDYYFPNMFEDIIFTNDLTDIAQKKGFVASNMGSSLHIDDHIEYATCTCDHAVPTYLFNKPWNASYTVENPLMRRVTGWKEILDIVK